MESVLALEVGAAARRIFSRAIWGEGRGGKGDGRRGTGHRPPSPPQEGVTGMYMWGGKKAWGASLERAPSTEPRGPPVLPSSPCTVAGSVGGPGTGSPQGLAPLLLPPGARRDQKTSYQVLPPAPWAWLSPRLSNPKDRISPSPARNLPAHPTLCPREIAPPSPAEQTPSPIDS